MKHITTIIALATLICMALSCGGRGTGTRKVAADHDTADSSATREGAAAEESAEAAGTISSQDHTTAHASANSDVDPVAAQPAKPIPPKIYGYKVIKELPHDTKAYTQGLFWHESYFYEGTGLEGHSELRKVDPASGNVVRRVKLDRNYFGEGIALVGGRIYQLTWTEGKALVYDAETFRLLRSFSYDGEGWGLTTDGAKLYMSDGSDNIFIRNPETFDIERIITVTSERRNVFDLNELEWIDGEIWANIYPHSDLSRTASTNITHTNVVRIDPATGNVTGIIDFNGLQAPADRLPADDVLNGIAHDPATGNIYVTGKRWNKIYQVKLSEKL